MVVVKIELWPSGDESKKRDIGEMRISNNSLGNETHGSYDVEIKHGGRFYGRPGNWKFGRVAKFNREFSPYHLVMLALRSCGIR